MMDLRIDTLTINDSAPRRQPAHPFHPRRADSDLLSYEHDNETSPVSSMEEDEDEEEIELRSALTSPNRDSYYTPSSERHVRWSAELAEIIDSSPSSSTTNPTKGLRKLLHRRSTSGSQGRIETLVAPQSSPPESSERKQGQRSMTPKGSYLKSKRRQS